MKMKVLVVGNFIESAFLTEFINARHSHNIERKFHLSKLFSHIKQKIFGFLFTSKRPKETIILVTNLLFHINELTQRQKLIYLLM